MGTGVTMLPDLSYQAQSIRAIRQLLQAELASTTHVQILAQYMLEQRKCKQIKHWAKRWWQEHSEFVARDMWLE